MITNPKRIHRRATLEALTVLALVLAWSGAGRIGWLPGPVAALTMPLPALTQMAASPGAAEQTSTVDSSAAAETNQDGAPAAAEADEEQPFHARGGAPPAAARKRAATPTGANGRAAAAVRVAPVWKNQAAEDPTASAAVALDAPEQPLSATPGPSETGVIVPGLDLAYDQDDLQQLLTRGCAALLLEVGEETYLFEPASNQTWPAGRWTRLNPALAKRLSNRFVRPAQASDARVKQVLKEIVKTAPVADGAALALRFYADFDGRLAAQQLAACRRAGLSDDPADATRLAQAVTEGRFAWAADGPQLVVRRVTLDGGGAPAVEGRANKEKSRHGS